MFSNIITNTLFPPRGPTHTSQNHTPTTKWNFSQFFEFRVFVIKCVENVENLHTFTHTCDLLTVGMEATTF